MQTLTRQQWARRMTIAGLIIAAINVALGWWMLIRAGSVTPIVSPDRFADSVQALRPDSLAERSEVRSLLVTSFLVANDHAVAVVVLAFAFTMVALGFALFVMGVESAFEFQGGQSDFGSVAIRATAPGLICFVLATILLAFTISRRTPVYDPSAPTSAGPDITSQRTPRDTTRGSSTDPP